MSTAQVVKQKVMEKMDHAIEHLKRDLAGLRTGRASVALVDGIKVDYYGHADSAETGGECRHS